MNPHILLLLKGLAVGIILALPTGPAGFLSIRQTLVNGYWAGFVSALGTLVTDLIYAIIVCFGITLISDFLLRNRLTLQAVGAMVLITTGVMIWRAKMPAVSEPLAIDYVKKFFATFSMSGLNPLVLVSSTALFSTIGGTAFLTARSDKFLFVAGIVIGGLLWWGLFLKGIVWAMKSFNAKQEEVVAMVNHVCGPLLILFGLAIFLKVWQEIYGDMSHIGGFRDGFRRLP